MGNDYPPKRSIKTAVKVFELIQLIEELDKATFSKLTKHTDMANSTLYEYLNTLDHLGYIILENNEYKLSLRFFDHGIKARSRVPVASAAGTILKQLANESGGTVWLAVEQNGKAVFIDKESGDQSVETHGRLGKHGYMHCLASGKAILANLPKERITDIIDLHGLPAETSQSITSTDELFNELEEIMEQGYAINQSESAEGACAVGAPIIVDDVVHGAISIPETMSRMNSEERRQELIDLVRNGTNKIEIQLRYNE